jgi:polyferredoxin
MWRGVSQRFGEGALETTRLGILALGLFCVCLTVSRNLLTWLCRYAGINELVTGDIGLFVVRGNGNERGFIRLAALWKRDLEGRRLGVYVASWLLVGTFYACLM